MGICQSLGPACLFSKGFGCRFQIVSESCSVCFFCQFWLSTFDDFSWFLPIPMLETQQKLGYCSVVCILSFCRIWRRFSGGLGWIILGLVCANCKSDLICIALFTIIVTEGFIWPKPSRVCVWGKLKHTVSDCFGSDGRVCFSPLPDGDGEWGLAGGWRPAGSGPDLLERRTGPVPTDSHLAQTEV